MRSFRLRPLSLIGLVLIAAGLTGACASEKPANRVHVLTWDGTVTPVMERYIDRGISTAERSDARAVVLRLDTPGGLDSAMRDVIQRIQASEVPVIVYVSPAGSRAASAGTFITMAGHVAAMAPNTSIGAATPINSSGEDIEGALGRKVTNDAVAYIRGIAEQRGRNADWAEQAVRDAVAVSESEAVRLNVVDFVATGIGDLLEKSDGRQVTVQGEAGGVRQVTLRTKGAATLENGTNIFEDLLVIIASPDIAFLLLSLGGLALLIELLTPGFGVGIFGVVALVLAYFSLGALPTNWAGVGLIALGLGLLLAEVFISGFGVFGIGGIVSLVIGGLILTGGNEAGFQVSRWLVVVFGVIVGGLVLLLGTTLFNLRRLRAVPLEERSLIGVGGAARTRLDPKGYVQVAGERWEATAEDPPIEDETPVIVTAVDGLRLTVKRNPASIKLLPAGAAAGAPPANEQPS